MNRTIIALLSVIAIGAVVWMLFFQTSSTIQQVTTTQLQEKLQQQLNSSAVFIDVREENEYTEGHIEGIANVPLSSLPNRLAEIPKDKEVVIICRSGNRSMQAAKLLQEQGYTNIVNVSGGMLDWKGPVKTGK
ncbi:rhodanese-like domain-containing protein [Brevibacillus sp. SYSU BS000544]|uniref:rhodanese-like domain-containing protein n=1 Tax=Brevibacillus sp. SYSU BS000544 TaxID=3416443 RepID=UPI003CE57A70